MPRKNKFKPGEPVRNLAELLDGLDKHEWFYFAGRPKHWSFMMHMNLNCLREAIMRGLIRHAIKQECEQCQ